MRIAVMVLAVVMTLVGTLLAPSPERVVWACYPNAHNFDEQVQDAQLIAIVRLDPIHVADQATVTPTPSLVVRTTTRKIRLTPIPTSRPVGPSTSSATAPTHPAASLSPQDGEVMASVERVLAADATGDPERDTAQLARAETRLGAILINQKDNFGCGSGNGGFEYAAGERYVVFVRRHEMEPPSSGIVLPVRGDEIPFIAQVHRATYDRFFSDLPAQLYDDFAVVYFSRIPLARFEDIVAGIRSEEIGPPDTGSGGYLPQ